MSVNLYLSEFLEALNFPHNYIMKIVCAGRAFVKVMISLKVYRHAHGVGTPIARPEKL